jgi:hypothetical protein
VGGVHTTDDVFLFCIRNEQKLVRLVRWDGAAPTTDYALPKNAPTEMTIDRAGTIWLNLGSLERKSRFVLIPRSAS